MGNSRFSHRQFKGQAAAQTEHHYTLMDDLQALVELV